MVSGHKRRKSGRSGGAVSSAFCFRVTVQSGITGLPGRGVPAGRRIWLNAGGRGEVRNMRPVERQEPGNGGDRDDAENADNAHEAKTEYGKFRGGRAGRKISGRNGKRTDAVSMCLSVSVADKERRPAGRKGNEASKRRWRGKRSKGRKKEEAREDEADGASDDQRKKGEGFQ